jgi:hypothetical protein
LHSCKIQLFCFQAIPNSLAKTPGVWRALLHSMLGVGRAGLGRSYLRTFRRLPDLVRSQGTFL